MRYVSTFSGIEAASVAWGGLGWEPVAFSEVDPFPSAVLAHRFPDVTNLGDITKVDWRDYSGSVDLVVGGSPCQSFSIAGKREGLAGASGLMFEYIRCVQELMPRWFVWENVPGALSSEGGAAFGQLLTEMDELGYGLAWRVLDAQFFGVAQRRRRVFLVGSLGEGGARRACEVLFETESLRWDTPSSRDKRKELAEAVEGRVTCDRGTGLGPKTLQVHCGCNGGGKGALIQNEMSATLSTVNNQTLFVPTRRTEVGDSGGQHVPNATAVPYREGSFAQFVEGEFGTLKASGGCLGGGSETIITELPKYHVRKLTPRECERLQGFPDDWTMVPYRGKSAEDCPDGPRYKAIGNSMAVPVMRWIGERIALADTGRNE